MDNKMTAPKQLITIGILDAIAVALGALGAHALKNQLPGGHITEDQLNGFDTAVKYQMYHTLAMFMVVILRNTFPHKFLNLAYTFFLDRKSTRLNSSHSQISYAVFCLKKKKKKKKK